MSRASVAPLRCPVCTHALSPVDEKSVACDQRHSFDFAKEGYLHLLPSGHGKGKLEGDSKEMLLARRRFFAAGHYAAVCAAVVDAAAVFVGAKNDPVIVDAGCGEGTYLSAIQARFSQSTCFGTDLSREAIRLAAKRDPRPLFAVADTAALPFADASVDVVVDVFAPRSGEFARVVTAGGGVVVAVPQADHLQELRALTGLGIAPHKEERVKEQLDGFDVDGDDVVHAVLPLTGGALVDLLTMTPHHHHAGDDDVLPQELAVTVSVKVLRFRRRG